IARGAPFGPDDGTLAPWVVVASLPFAPEIVIPTVRQFARLDLGMSAPYGFKPSFNQTFAVEESPTGWWVTPYHFGIDQGPVVLMIENYRSGLIWDIMRGCPAVIAGLRRAGFTGGWLVSGGMRVRARLRGLLTMYLVHAGFFLGYFLSLSAATPGSIRPSK